MNYMDSFKKFLDGKLRDFFSSLKDKCITEKYYCILLMFGLFLK